MLILGSLYSAIDFKLRVVASTAESKAILMYSPASVVVANLLLPKTANSFGTVNVASALPAVLNNSIVSPTLIKSGFDASVPLMEKDPGFPGVPCVASFTSSVSSLLVFIENTIA